MTKVLIIEDNNDIRENVIEILELSGYEVYEASNGKEGIELAVKHQPDIVLCDIMMPEVDGYGVLEALNDNEQTRATPFIFLTAKAERPDIRRGMELGADDYLTKPFDDTELLRAVESRLKKKEIHQLFYGQTPEKLNEVVSKKDGLEELKQIMQERSSRKFKKNQHIHYEGDRVTGIYFIISGRVKTVKLTEDGRELITGIHKANDYLDISIILSNDTYNDTAIALEDTELSFLPVEQLDRLLYLYPDIGVKFIKLLANNIQEKEQRLLQIAYASVRKRIAETIVRLLNQHSNDGKSIKISRDDLAALSGTAPETVSRTLTDFKSEGLIDKEGSTLHVLNFDKLNRLKN
ncbi:transcriptional regulator [Flavobacterium cyanobacteriorum]|uniref:Transcriptional regulator n=1 Tax=Flavobacterium cyanobacteriorum TaxID=2022802 RepID=A0A255ZQC1_9FLAO|nr:response regulator [Flavobacterium cyanobacteriorum]OYQ43075.1 transcriptional regulator [Flavobacterium cyanobacteriorum]